MSKGIFARRTRRLSKHHKASSLTIANRIKKFSIGDNVVIVPKGNTADIPHPRYRGKVGRVIEKRGSAYVVEIKTSKSLTRKIIAQQRHIERHS
jgi:large subunit ribosomal protein L21e